MRIGVLGPVSIDGDADALTRRDRIVLSALVTAADRPLTADSLADALWGTQPPASSTKIVQGCVVRLRRALGPDAIATQRTGYRLVAAADDVDARRFTRLVQRGRDLLALDQPARAAHTIREAIALWRGTPLPDLDGWDPGRLERERLEELRRDADELLLDAELRAGHHAEMLADAERLVDAAPLRERRWGLLARAQYHAGRQVDALQTLYRARVMLSTELGLDPGPQLTALQRQILRHDARLRVLPADDPSPVCPYLGLVAYDVADEDGFFGRTADIDACLTRLRDTGVLAVVGPSGSGKSSLVRAGIAARLQRDSRPVTIITPGDRPMDALTAVRGSTPVLIVDQCEELAALGDPTQRAAFSHALTEHAATAPLVLAVRADWITELSTDAGLARIIERGLYLLGPMDAADLRAAIEGPAARAGLLVEPGLVDLLVHEVEDEPGALPLLSHALRTTWQYREGETLTVAGYTAAGGIRGAVAKTAETVYTGVPAEQRPLLRDLLLRLVTQTADGMPMRARLPRRLLIDDTEHERLVERLVDERLATIDGDAIELAHEAVTRAWPRLRAWLDDDAAGQRILRHLSVAADTWDQVERPDSELYRGVRLAHAVEWRDRVHPRLTPTEQAFLDTAVTRAQAARREAEERVAQQARTNRRLRRLLVGVGVLSLMAVVAGLVAFAQGRRANRAAVAADARRVGAQALATDAVDLSLLLAVEGVRLDDSPDTRTSLLTALGRSPQLAGVLRPAGSGPLGTVTISGDGRTIAVYDNANRLHFHDADTGALRGTFVTDDVIGTATQLTGRATFHPDGGPVAVSVSTLGARPVRLLDPDTLDEVPDQLGGFPGSWLLPWDVVYSPDGRRLAVAFDRYPERDSNVVRDSIIVVWDMAAPGEPAAVLTDGARFAHGLAFSPDGRMLYAGVHAAPPLFDTEPAITVFDLEDGTVARTLMVPSFPFSLSPDGTRIAAPGAAPDSPNADAAAQIVVVDAENGDELQHLRGHVGPITAIAFSPDGTRLASASADRSVALWNAVDGARVDQFEGHAGEVSSVEFGHDGRTLVSAGDDRAILVWDFAGDRRFVSVRTTIDDLLEGGRVNRLAQWALPSPAGDRVVYQRTRLDDAGNPITLVQVVDTTTGRGSDAIDSGHGAFAIAAWHPDGTRFASSGLDGVVRLWDAATASVIAERAMDMGALPGLTFLGGGDELLVGAFGGPMRRVDGETLAPVAGQFVTSAGGPAWTYASPDGRTVAVITGGPARTGSGTVAQPYDRLLLVDPRAGEVRHEIDLGFGSEWADFSPDGALVAVTGGDGQVAIIDVEAGALVGPVVEGHDGDVVSVSYSPDGDLVASGGADGRMSLWDGQTGALLGSVRVGQPGSEAYVRFAPDGSTVVIATFDGEILTFDTRTEQWVAHACAVAGRNLTAQEWRDAFGVRAYRETCDTR